MTPSPDERAHRKFRFEHLVGRYVANPTVSALTPASAPRWARRSTRLASRPGCPVSSWCSGRRRPAPPAGRIARAGRRRVRCAGAQR